MDIGNLLEFQGAFKGRRHNQGTAKKNASSQVAIVSGKNLDGDPRDPRSHALFRNGPYPIDEFFDAFRRQSSRKLGNIQGKEQHDNKLRRIGFR